MSPGRRPLTELPFSRRLESDLLAAAERRPETVERWRLPVLRRPLAYALVALLLVAVPLGIARLLDVPPEIGIDPLEPPPAEVGFLDARVADVPAGDDVAMTVSFTLSGRLGPGARVVVDFFELPDGVRYPPAPAQLRGHGGSGEAWFYPFTPSFDYTAGGRGDDHGATITLTVDGWHVPEGVDVEATAWFYRDDGEEGTPVTFRFGGR